MWKTTIIRNTQNPDICTVSAVWTETDEQGAVIDTFTFSRERVNIANGGKAAFATEAKAALDLYLEKKAETGTDEEEINELLNA